MTATTTTVSETEARHLATDVLGARPSYANRNKNGRTYKYVLPHTATKTAEQAFSELVDAFKGVTNVKVTRAAWDIYALVKVTNV